MTTQKNTTKVGFQLQPLELPTNVLPTKGNVICAINFEKDINRKTFAEAIDIVVKDIVSLWKEASLPIVDVATVRTLIKRLHQNYLNTVRNYYLLDIIIIYNRNRKSYMQKLKYFEVYEIVYLNKYVYKTYNLFL